MEADRDVHMPWQQSFALQNVSPPSCWRGPQCIHLHFFFRSLLEGKFTTACTCIKTSHFSVQANVRGVAMRSCALCCYNARHLLAGTDSSPATPCRPTQSFNYFYYCRSITNSTLHHNNCLYFFRCNISNSGQCRSNTYKGKPPNSSVILTTGAPCPVPNHVCYGPNPKGQLPKLQAYIWVYQR